MIIPDEKQDKNLAKRIISKELSGIFNWVLEGLDRLLKQQQFTESPKAKELLEEMRFESDTVAQFIESKEYVPSKSKEKPVLYKTFKDEYKTYCMIEDLKPVGNRELGTRLRSLGFEIERYGSGGKVHIFLKKDPVYKVIEDTFNIKDNDTLD